MPRPKRETSTERMARRRIRSWSRCRCRGARRARGVPSEARHDAMQTQWARVNRARMHEAAGQRTAALRARSRFCGRRCRPRHRRRTGIQLGTVLASPGTFTCTANASRMRAPHERDRLAMRVRWPSVAHECVGVWEGGREGGCLCVCVRACLLISLPHPAIS